MYFHFQEEQQNKFQEELEGKLSDQEEELKRSFDNEKHDILLKYETEKNILQKQYAEEQAKLIERYEIKILEDNLQYISLNTVNTSNMLLKI